MILNAITGHRSQVYKTPYIIKTTCKDGSYSTTDANKRGVCNKHGGPAANYSYTKAEKAVNDSFVKWINLDKIYVAPAEFQNRKTDFSEKSVNKIITAVQNGTFNWQVLDPILLWLAPDKKYYILSGHSRTAAFSMLAAKNITYQGRKFNQIPAKVIKTDLVTAKTIALESNTLASPETQTERAFYYQQLRNQGQPEKELKDMIYLKEANNANSIYPYSFLDTKGKAWQGLEAIENGDASSKKIYEDIALWLGKARYQYPFLTNAHERELYDYLFSKGYYAKLNQTSFLAKLNQVIERATTFGKFDVSKPLNIAEQASKTLIEQTYDANVQAAKAELVAAQKLRDQKLKEFTSRTKDKAKIQQVMAPYEQAVYYNQQALVKLINQKDQVMNASKNQGNLFLSGRNRYKLSGPETITYLSKPNYDTWGCEQWKSWLIALNGQFSQEKSKDIWLAWFTSQSKWSNVYNWCKYDADFTNVLKKYGITEVSNVFSDVVNAGENAAGGIADLFGWLGKNIVPVAITVGAVYFFKEEIKTGAKNGVKKVSNNLKTRYAKARKK